MVSEPRMGSSIAERSAPLSKHIRFTLSQDERLEKSCAYLGCTLQNFIHEATLERLAKVETEQRALKDHREQSKKESKKKREVRGLGLRVGQPEEALAAEPPPPAPAVPQIVVNVPAAAAPASDASMLAAFVTKGSILQRDVRLERAREILAASLDGASLDAAKKALDEAIAASAARAPKTGVLDWFKK